MSKELGKEGDERLSQAIHLGRSYFRGGWIYHTWSILPLVAFALNDIGRVDDAAVLALACRSGPTGAADAHLLDPFLDHLKTLLGPNEMARLEHEASQLDLVALLRRAQIAEP